MTILLTYNTWKCDGNYPQRLAQLSPSIIECGADIIFLQEVFRVEDGSSDTLEILGLLNDDYFVFSQAARCKERTTHSGVYLGCSSLAIASLHTPLAQGSFSLPGSHQDPYRHCLWIRCRIDGLDLVAINTHLTHITTGLSLRRQQFNRIRQFCDQLDCDLVLIGGDLNASPADLIPDNDIECCFSPPYPNTLNGERQACLDHVYLLDRSDTGYTFDQTSTLWHGDDPEAWPSDHRAVLTHINAAATVPEN